jgi:hypothetical protein
MNAKRADALAYAGFLNFFCSGILFKGQLCLYSIGYPSSVWIKSFQTRALNHYRCLSGQNCYSTQKYKFSQIKMLERE